MFPSEMEVEVRESDTALLRVPLEPDLYTAHDQSRIETIHVTLL